MQELETLRTLVDRYVDEHPYGLAPRTVEQLQVSVAAWEHFAGRRITLDDLDDRTLNRYLDWLRLHRSPDTFRTRRGNILRLWRWAFEEEILDVAPRRIRRLRPTQRLPEAWTRDEVLRLFAAAHRLHRRWRGVSWNQAIWTESLLRAGYDTALRLGDLLALEPKQLDVRMRITAHKTGRPLVVCLRSETLDLARACVGDHGRSGQVWPLWKSRNAFYEHIRKVVRLAEVREGTFRWLRRAAITACEGADPGSGTRLAGHAARSTTEQWYIDRSQLDKPVLPPL